MEQENEQKASLGLKILSFFIPLAGLIIFACNISKKPKYAKECGAAALFGFIITVILSLFFPVFLGIGIFNSVQDTISETELDTIKISSFNSRYESYKGTQKGNYIKSLISEVKRNNLDSEENQIIVFLDGEEINLNSSSNDIKVGKDYNVELDYDTNTGFVNQINITTER